MIYIGTSGYSYKHWVGLFYPKDLSPSKFLEFYAKHFNIVEINYTFYKMPTEKIIKGWVTRTPDDFGFVIKCPRLITHRKKLTDVDDILSSFTNTIKLMQNKLKVILHQLPPSFKKETKNIDKLYSYLKILPKDLKHAVEFRDNSWIGDDEIIKMLSSFSISNCIISAPEIKCVPVCTASFVYIRMHGTAKWYSYDYKKEELDWWIAKIQEFANNKKDVYMFFNNDTNAYAVKNADYIQNIIKRWGVT